MITEWWSWVTNFFFNWNITGKNIHLNMNHPGSKRNQCAEWQGFTDVKTPSSMSWFHTRDLQHFSPRGSEDPPRGEGLVRGGLKAHPSLQRLIKHVASHLTHPFLLSLTLFIQSGQAVNWHLLTLVEAPRLPCVHLHMHTKKRGAT